MRAWQFSVLFRLGYPIRVLMDDHMRIATQLNWGAFLLTNGKESAGNAWHNQAPAFLNKTGRRSQINDALRTAKVQRREMLDALENPETFRYAERADEIKLEKWVKRPLRQKLHAHLAYSINELL